MKNAKLTGVALVAAVSLVAAFEGLRTEAYEDVISVWTICYGDTKGVKRGQTATPAECDHRLYERLQQYDAELSRCITRDIPDNVRIATLSLAYNAGASAICKSTLVRKLNAGDIKGACDEFPRWRYAAGREWQGLLNRRLKEQQVCRA